MSDESRRRRERAAYFDPSQQAAVWRDTCRVGTHAVSVRVDQYAGEVVVRIGDRSYVERFPDPPVRVLELADRFNLRGAYAVPCDGGVRVDLRCPCGADVVCVAPVIDPPTDRAPIFI